VEDDDLSDVDTDQQPCDDVTAAEETELVKTDRNSTQGQCVSTVLIG